VLALLEEDLGVTPADAKPTTGPELVDSEAERSGGDDRRRQVSEPGLVRFGNVAAPVHRIFCLHHAGGGPSTFRTWSDGLPGIDVCAIGLPGREARLTEEPIRTLKTLVSAIADTIDRNDDLPFAIFGHSFGGLLAFEAARELRRRGGPMPTRLFVAACRAPQVFATRAPIHRLPDDAFVSALAKLGGISDRLAADPEVMRLFLPALRADFSMLETYVHMVEEPLAVPLTALWARGDVLVDRVELAEAWTTQTHADFSLHTFDGGHFFIEGNRSEIFRIISEELGLVDAAAGW
jgi:medium-chain acyl-[acyl-carrier-protein] hydrolase